MNGFERENKKRIEEKMMFLCVTYDGQICVLHTLPYIVISRVS